MKRLLFIPLVLVSIANAFGQKDTIWISEQEDWTAYTIKYDWDTVFYASKHGNEYLKGTARIPWSTNQESLSKSAGLVLLSVESSDCASKDEPVDHIENEIQSIELTDNELTIKAHVKANCCCDFLGDVAVRYGISIDLKYFEYGNICGCECCYVLTYKFRIEDQELFKSIESVTLNSLTEKIKLR